MKKEVVIVSDSIRNKVNYTALEYSYLRAFSQKDFNCDLISFNINPYLHFALSKFYPQQLNYYLGLKQKPILNYLKNTDKKYVFVIKGYFLLPETIEELKSLGKFVFCFYPDDPFRILPGTSTQFVKESIVCYNAYFIWSTALVKRIKEMSSNNVYYLPFAADYVLLNPPDYSPNINNADMAWDVSFVGNADKERTDFLNILTSKLGSDCKKIIYGAWWKKMNDYVIKKNVHGNDFINAILSSKINLNILRVQNKNSNNMRTFEIPTIGGFMLHEYSEEAMEFFVPGVEADYFKDVEECADKIKFYLKNETIRQKIARAGHEKIFSAKHIYTDRVEEIWQKII
ncbi:MAG: hypothetical protein A2315_15895 [Ignavibacteria bacterium RIFOXYB2_FULL_35_12]|nr:MAG: hypothetical protein A2058_00985 [Ignavibacteria bacterium GWA2_36_19]OGU60864.1 MAG: hypothetical protein A2X60_15425 [Ignavibacteria bacterium GWF2_35_20]OGU80191.1 MAG: hypothetical protein A2254_02970 [Ignavibacteria bacterium RIFOXYA2_FULL_35_9]OGU92072.1 MAG: hypothetical protein A3K31_12725 [Ignavibacteria bacterium RIFOXYA12_FULL_35_25]OGU95709.1 MAG: hypothetical protein A2347_01520 [Ignavibacteria bacterium RIFOXYB12_FULL_35_14]OGU98844.1 MAG: hypothetical protein A2455_02605